MECEKRGRCCPEKTYALLAAGSSSVTDRDAPEIWLAGSLNVPSQKYEDILIITAGSHAVNDACKEYAIRHHAHLKVIPAVEGHFLQAHTIASAYPNRGALLFWDGRADEMVRNFHLSRLYKTPSYTVHIGYDKAPSDDLDGYRKIDPRRLMRIRRDMRAEYPYPDDAFFAAKAERVLWIGSDRGRATGLNVVDTRYVDSNLKKLAENDPTDHGRAMYNSYLQAFDEAVEAEKARRRIW